MAYDREEVLARIDVATLADELLGPHRGRGPSMSWPCPDPGHGPQTGRTPPVTVFAGRAGEGRWHCHGCGAGGTAADLVITTQHVSFGEALDILGRRAGVAERNVGVVPLRPPRVDRGVQARAPASVSPAIEEYVRACEAHLWSPAGRPVARWLHLRGLEEDVLVANRVGSDPGPERLARAAGLPRGGRAAVFPVLDGEDRAVYVQARYLRPGSHKYANPAFELVGPSPRVAELRPVGSAVDREVVLVTEGLPDGLTAAQAGFRSVAVLGAGMPDARVAEALTRMFPIDRLVVAFDADFRGRAGAEQLVCLLADRGSADRVATLAVPEAWNDLNGWLQGAGRSFDGELDAALVRACGSRGLSDTADRGLPAILRDVVGLAPASSQTAQAAERIAPELIDDLEAIRYRFVLADPSNVERIERLVEHRLGSSPGVADSRAHDGLDEAIERLAYRHLLVDDPVQAAANRAHVGGVVARWSAEFERSVPQMAVSGPAVEVVSEALRPPPVPEQALEIGM